MLDIKEEKIANKINFSVWSSVFKYIFKHAWVFILLVISMFLNTLLYDSLRPLLNNAAVNALDKGTIISWTNSKIPFTILGLNIELNMTTFLIATLGIIVINSIVTGAIMFLTHYLNVLIMSDMRKDSLKRYKNYLFHIMIKHLLVGLLLEFKVILLKFQTRLLGALFN